MMAQYICPTTAVVMIVVIVVIAVIAVIIIIVIIVIIVIVVMCLCFFSSVFLLWTSRRGQKARRE